MISTITFTHGVKTCIDPETEKECRWVTRFAKQTVCQLCGDIPIFGDDRGWLQRCGQCIEEFGETL
jgi:hypothetical protein